MSEEAEEFQVEDIEGVVKMSLQATISQESRYDPETANNTSRTLLEACIKNLAALGKPFKYVVTAVIMQKNGAGLHTAMGSYWDARKDGEWGLARARLPGCPWRVRTRCATLHSLPQRTPHAPHPTPSQAWQQYRGRMRPCTL